MRTIMLSSISALAIAFALPALAQTAPSENKAPEEMQVEDATTAERSTFFSYREVKDDLPITGDNLETITQYLDREVYDLENTRIGEVADLLVDPSSNVVTHAMVDVSRFLGDEQKYVAIPLSQLQISADQNVAMTALTKPELTRMASYESMGEMWAIGEEMDGDMATASGPTDEAVKETMKMTGMNVAKMPADDILGRPVMTSDGEAAGEVDDILLDGQNSVTHVVVGVGGFLGFGKKPISLPVQDVSAVEGDALYVDMTLEELKGLPEFESPAAQTPPAEMTQ